MGRKKKAQKQVVVQSNTLGYQGHVQLQLVRGNKVLSTKQYHNNGMPKLWEFLAACLAGDRAEQLRPTTIKLFNYKAADTVSPTTFNWSEAFSSFNMIEATPFVTYSAAPVKAPDDPSTTTKWTVTLHFTIPASYISQEEIHVIGLYPTNASNNETNAAAYYICAKEENNEVV